MENSAGIFARVRAAKFLLNNLRNPKQQKKVGVKGVGHKLGVYVLTIMLAPEYSTGIINPRVRIGVVIVYEDNGIDWPMRVHASSTVVV